MRAAFRMGGIAVGLMPSQVTCEKIDHLVSRNALALAIVREEAVREALGRWVSELEPVLVFDASMRFVGLTHAGQERGGYPPISVRVKGGKGV